jgi:CubicO group peptidase (beta-lactamase class C family)
MKALVTEPIGMSDTGFVPPERSRLATPYADGAPPIRMGDPYLLPLPDGHRISYSPGRAFDPHSFPSGGGGMNGTAEDVARLLEVVRTGGGKILKPATAHAMLINQTGSLPIIFGTGWGFGFGGALLTDPKAAKTPQSLGTWAWGGAWGHSWFVDPMSRLVVVALTNTAVEGMSGKFPTDVRDAVYGKK